jgi:antitoxin ParD1/3/4
MYVSLTPELEQFVKKEVDGGLYQTSSEVIRAGLRRLKEDQDARRAKGPKRPAELEARLLEGVERLDRGEGVDGEEVFRRLRKRIKAAHADDKK